MQRKSLQLKMPRGLVEVVPPKRAPPPVHLPLPQGQLEALTSSQGIAVLGETGVITLKTHMIGPTLTSAGSSDCFETTVAKELYGYHFGSFMSDGGMLTSMS